MAPMLNKPVPSSLAQVYRARGPIQKFRFAEASAFVCFRCEQAKKSKLIAVYNQDWSTCLCTGCYRHLLSIYNVKAGTQTHDARTESLGTALLATVSADAKREAQRIFQTSEQRARFLSPETLCFVSTAEHVACQLSADPHLEWSPAVIGLCKAVESEVVGRILQPLAARAAGQDLGADKLDNDLSRVAAFCIDATGKPPELGAFNHFLEVAIHSQHRRHTSKLLATFFVLCRDWVESHWILQTAGLSRAMSELIKEFRNPAAHIDELSQKDYEDCRRLVIGADGMLWRIILATSTRDSPQFSRAAAGQESISPFRAGLAATPVQDVQYHSPSR
jgi:hypothetical protein